MLYSSRIIFHVDMDAFFASVEQRDHPAYRGKPVIVGARPGTRGVVSAASYEARRFGVRSAMPISEAHARCPHGIFIRPRMEAYAEESERVMEILRSFTPLVEQVSVDEAFMDMSGTERLHGPAIDAARHLAARIRAERRLTASIGIAPNKFLAKLASDMHKPDGITVAPAEADARMGWLALLPVGKIWGVGKKTQEVLAQSGIRMIGDVQRMTAQELRRRFGKWGAQLYALSRGIDDREVGEGDGAKSISREHTFSADSSDPQQWRRLLRTLAADVARQAREADVKGRTVTLIYRLPDFSRHSRRVTLARPTCISAEIFAHAMRMLECERISSLRLLGVGIAGFEPARQMDLFEGVGEKPWEKSEKALDRIQARFGREAIWFGGEERNRGA